MRNFAMNMEIYIRNMVCRHCVATVERALTEAGIPVDHVELGRAVVDCDESMLPTIDRILADNDFERIADPDTRLVEQVKHAVIEHVRNIGECHLNLSACLADKLGVNYDHASRVFSRIEGRTIEKYQILQKIELVKELMGEPGMTLAEIADRAGYSSVAHLSRQFKGVTGMTPTAYMASGTSSRKSIDRL